ncbi:trypsin-1 [Leptinotarsa decemlineata]|uniref:trypsin-1 n=1 Tax=Leptinotarsa decemlineata TaxID=7539 RepID=UPI003D30AF64
MLVRKFCEFSVLVIFIFGSGRCYFTEGGKTANFPTLRHQTNKSREERFLFNPINGLFNLFGSAANDFTFDEDDTENDDGKTRNCSCECGVSNPEKRIVGGRPTGINRYPWIARIVYDGHYHCGASLLTKEYVLTAAHCVRRLKKSKIRVVLGDHDVSTTAEIPAMMRAVTSVIRHRNFDQDTYNHDIALLKLRKPVEFTKQIRPICLPKTLDPSGRTGTVVGWGRTAEGGMLPTIVQEVQVPILTLSQCRAMKYRASRITTYMLCAGKGLQDSCQGDSGGPLLVHSGDKYEIVGIVSWGVGCGRPGYPGVYTRVSKYINWLKYNLDDSCLCS